MNFWGLEYAATCLSCALLLAYWAWRNVAPIVGLACFWFTCSALRIFAQPFSPWAHESPEWAMIFDFDAAQALAEFVLIIGAVFALPLNTWKRIFRAVAILNSAAIIIGAPFGMPYGVLLNASMSGCFAACLLPLAISSGKYDAAKLLLIVLSCVLTGQTLPVLCLIAVTLCSGFCRKQYKATLAVIALMLLAGVIAARGHFAHTSGRLSIWQAAFDWWRANANYAIGTGSGSFVTIGIFLSRTLSKYGNTIFTWLHSDWLQIGFEQGLVGLALTVALYVTALRRASPASVASALVGFGAWGIANMPLRYPLAALYGAFLLRQAFATAPKGTHRLRSNSPA